MRCDIDHEQILTLHVDVPTFCILQTAISFYVERSSLPAGHPAREMMWKFAGLLSNLQKNKIADAKTIQSPPETSLDAPALCPPTPVGSPTPPLAEVVSLTTVEAPEGETWDNEEGDEIES